MKWKKGEGINGEKTNEGKYYSKNENTGVKICVGNLNRDMNK
jgi:hypothetical protein